MTRIEKTIEINAPPETIFSFANWDNVPKIYDSIKSAEWTSKEKNSDGYVTVRIPVELANEIDEIVESGVLGCGLRTELVKDAVRQKTELLRHDSKLSQ